jgi:hypothetical protein
MHLIQGHKENAPMFGIMIFMGPFHIGHIAHAGHTFPACFSPWRGPTLTRHQKNKYGKRNER